MSKKLVRLLAGVFVVGIALVIFPQKSFATNCSTGTTIDDTNSCISYSSNWAYGHYTDGAENNSIHYSNTPGKTATFHLVRSYQDQSLYIRYRGTPSSGKAHITLNGTTIADVDLYRSSTQYFTEFYSIYYVDPPASGPDTFVISVSSSKNASSTSYYVSLDSISVGY